jgi:hypothetical protein
MSKSTDERIEAILKAKPERTSLAEQVEVQAAAAAKQQIATAESIRTKWTHDTHFIVATLKEFEQKMSALGLELSFQDADAPQGGLIAQGSICGRTAETPINLILNVDQYGEIHAHHGPDHDLKPVISIKRVFVPTAQKSDYEELILEHLGPFL